MRKLSHLTSTSVIFRPLFGIIFFALIGMIILYFYLSVNFLKLTVGNAIMTNSSQSGSRDPDLSGTPVFLPFIAKTAEQNLDTNWKTYVNSSYGFSIQYPSELNYKIWSLEGDENRKFYMSFMPINRIDKHYTPEISLIIYTNSRHQSIAAWLQENTSNLQASSAISDTNRSYLFEEVQDIKSNQVTTANEEEISSIRFIEMSPRWNITAPTILMPKGDYIFQFSYTNAYSDEDLASRFEAMVKTFKFAQTR